MGANASPATAICLSERCWRGLALSRFAGRGCVTARLKGLHTEFRTGAGCVARASALAVREVPYVDAARALGLGHARIVLRHMVPNVVAPFLILFSAFVGQAILPEAALSYLGLGVQEHVPAWGLMLQGSAEDYATTAPWIAIFPGLRGGAFSAVLRDTMAVSGALFALFVAATTFTLLFRAFGTDQLLDRLVAQVPGGATGAAIAVLVTFALCAFVLDAFEIVFVIVPIVMPAVLTRAPDAVWISVLALLALQASFLIPPTGYAVMMARSAVSRNAGQNAPMGALARALAPYLVAQLIVLALVVAMPRIAHLAQPGAGAAPPPVVKIDDDEARKRFNDMLKLPPPE